MGVLKAIHSLSTAQLLSLVPLLLPLLLVLGPSGTNTALVVQAERNAESESVCRPFLTSRATSPLDSSLHRNVVVDEEGEFHCELVLQDRDLPPQIRVTVHEGLMQLAMRHIEMDIPRHKAVLRHARILREIIPSHKGFAINVGTLALDPKSYYPEEAMEAFECALYGECGNYAEGVSIAEEYRAYVNLARIRAYYGDYIGAIEAVVDAWLLTSREDTGDVGNADCGLALAIELYSTYAQAAVVSDSKTTTTTTTTSITTTRSGDSNQADQGILSSVRNATDVLRACAALKEAVYSAPVVVGRVGSSSSNAGTSTSSASSVAINGCGDSDQCTYGHYDTSSSGTSTSTATSTRASNVPRLIRHASGAYANLMKFDQQSILSSLTSTSARATIERIPLRSATTSSTGTSSASTSTSTAQSNVALGLNVASLFEYAPVAHFVARHSHSSTTSSTSTSTSSNGYAEWLTDVINIGTSTTTTTTATTTNVDGTSTSSGIFAIDKGEEEGEAAASVNSELEARLRLSDDGPTDTDTDTTTSSSSSSSSDSSDSTSTTNKSVAGAVLASTGTTSTSATTDVIMELDPNASLETLRFKVGLFACSSSSSSISSSSSTCGGVLPLQAIDDSILMTLAATSSTSTPTSTTSSTSTSTSATTGAIAKVRLVSPDYAVALDTVHPTVYIATSTSSTTSTNSDSNGDSTSTSTSGASYQYIADTPLQLHSDLNVRLRRVSRLSSAFRNSNSTSTSSGRNQVVVPYAEVTLRPGDYLYVPAHWFAEITLYTSSNSSSSNNSSNNDSGSGNDSDSGSGITTMLTWLWRSSDSTTSTTTTSTSATSTTATSTADEVRRVMRAVAEHVRNA